MTVRVLSYNIWFSDHALQLRMHAIAEIIVSQNPHIIALQEVTHTHWDALQKHPVFSLYEWSSPPRSRYYTMIGSLRAWALFEELQRHEYDTSGMGRDLLHGIVRPPGAPPIVIGTSHLESLNQVHTWNPG